jgi:hypothetical protein
VDNHGNKSALESKYWYNTVRNNMVMCNCVNIFVLRRIHGKPWPTSQLYAVPWRPLFIERLFMQVGLQLCCVGVFQVALAIITSSDKNWLINNGIWGYAERRRNTRTSRNGTIIQLLKQPRPCHEHISNQQTRSETTEINTTFHQIPPNSTWLTIQTQETSWCLVVCGGWISPYATVIRGTVTVYTPF